MADIQTLNQQIQEQCAAWIDQSIIAFDELTLIVKGEHLLALCHVLRDQPEFAFNGLMDVCGVDYLQYGIADWQTDSATETGFSRGVTDALEQNHVATPNRFAVVYHLLSYQHNHRVRLRVFLPDDVDIIVDSVVDLWPAANWFERETFDLYGILFHGHPDLRRLLTDYGFVGHPFRKDFPLIGKVEVRYDAAQKRVIYEPVSITARVLEPKVIRHDHRYLVPDLGVTHAK